MPQKKFETQPIRIYKEQIKVPSMNKKTHSFYKNFDDLQSRISNLKSARNWEKKFKSDSVTTKKWSITCLLPELEIILDDSLAFTMKVYE